MTNSFNIVVQSVLDSAQDGLLLPIGSDDVYRVVLTWGESPRDLDSHVTGTLNNGSNFHVYYKNKNATENGEMVCNLDVDGVSGYGRETITLKMSNTTPYYYYVYQYSSDGSLITSDAQVKLYRGNTLLGTYNVPSSQRTGSCWNVFAIVDGNIIMRNTVMSSEDLSYASVNAATVRQMMRSISSDGQVQGTKKSNNKRGGFSFCALAYAGAQPFCYPCKLNPCRPGQKIMTFRALLLLYREYIRHYMEDGAIEQRHVSAEKLVFASEN